MTAQNAARGRVRYAYAATLAAGIANAVEPGQNATLADALGDPLAAGLVCFVVSFALFGLIALATRAPLRPDAPRSALARTPAWAWGGGLLGAGIVLAQLTLSEQVGAATFLGLEVTAGVVGSILLDHFGWVGFEQRDAGRGRIVGGLLMIAGVALVALT